MNLKIDRQSVFVFLLVLCSLNFFSARIAQDGFLKLFSFSFILLAVIISLQYFFQKGGFSFPIQLICISILFSVFMARYSWGQAFQDSASIVPYTVWITFFLLLRLNVPIKTIESIVLIYGIIYMLLFLFQFFNSNVVYFGYHTEFNADRGVIRVNFPGAGVFFLSCFIALNKITSNVKNKFWWCLFALSGIVIIILQVTRQVIAVMLLIYLIHFLRTAKLPFKLAVLAFFIAGIYIFLNANTPISKGLIEQQKEDASYGDKYIRLLSADYFLKDFSPNLLSKVFGNGLPNNNSDYGIFILNLQSNYGYYFTDVGLIGFYALFGILPIIAIIIIFIKGLSFPVPKEYYYLKYYIGLLIITCLTSDNVYSTSFTITNVFVIYCYQVLYLQKTTVSSALSNNPKYIPKPATQL